MFSKNITTFRCLAETFQFISLNLKVVAFYNGVHIPGEISDETDSWEDCAYRIFVEPFTNSTAGKYHVSSWR